MLNQLLLTEFTLCCRRYYCTIQNPPQYLHPLHFHGLVVKICSLKIKSKMRHANFCYCCLDFNKKKSQSYINTYTPSSKVSEASKIYISHSPQQARKKYTPYLPQTIPSPTKIPDIISSGQCFFYFLFSFWNQALFSTLEKSAAWLYSKHTHNPFSFLLPLVSKT